MKILKYSKITIEKFVLSAGTYVVGDLFYIVPSDQKICDECIESSRCFDATNGGGALAHFTNEKNEDIQIIGIGTANGDGIYYDQTGRKYEVDSKMIGIILASDIPEDLRISSNQYHQIEFQNDFEVSTDISEGYITIGHLRIRACGSYHWHI